MGVIKIFTSESCCEAHYKGSSFPLTHSYVWGKAFEGRGTASSQSLRWAKARPVEERAREPMRMELRGKSSRRRGE